jgi:hypothetical protein
MDNDLFIEIPASMISSAVIVLVVLAGYCASSEFNS